MKENEFTHKNLWKDNCLDCDKLKKTWFFFLKIEITNKNKITSNNHKKSSYDENNLVVILFSNSNIGHSKLRLIYPLSTIQKNYPSKSKANF